MRKLYRLRANFRQKPHARGATAPRWKALLEKPAQSARSMWDASGECCAARGSQEHIPEQLWHSNAATVTGSSSLKAGPKREAPHAAKGSIKKRAPRDVHITLACALEQDSNRALQQLLSVSNTCSGPVLDFSNTSSRSLSYLSALSDWCVCGFKSPQTVLNRAFLSNAQNLRSICT